MVEKLSKEKLPDSIVKFREMFGYGGAFNNENLWEVQSAIETFIMSIQAEAFTSGKRIGGREVIKKVKDVLSDKRIKALEKNLEIAFGIPECEVCGYNPRHQKLMLIEALLENEKTYITPIK